MHNYCVNKLLDLKEVKVKKIIHSDSQVKIYIETKATLKFVLVVGKQLSTFTIIDIRPLDLTTVETLLSNPKKASLSMFMWQTFFEKYDFLTRYQQRSTRLTKYR